MMFSRSQQPIIHKWLFMLAYIKIMFLYRMGHIFLCVVFLLQATNTFSVDNRRYRKTIFYFLKVKHVSLFHICA